MADPRSKTDDAPRDTPIGLDIEFPVMVACVDMGSNAIRFLAAEFTSDHEMQLVANVARYHRKAHPAEHHPEFMAREENDRIRVTRLASLLRVADSLDREHVQRVTDLTAKLSDNELTLWLDGSAGLLLEGWSLKKKANLFHKLFGRKVKLRFLGEEQDVET